MYIINILVVDRGIPPQHIDQLSLISARLHAAGLKVDAPKCRFGLN